MTTPASYEFHVYKADENGHVEGPIRCDTLTCFGEGAAKRAARKLARDAQAPVDVALEGAAPWADRYVGTASPGLFGAGTVWERLD